MADTIKFVVGIAGSGELLGKNEPEAFNVEIIDNNVFIRCKNTKYTRKFYNMWKNVKQKAPVIKILYYERLQKMILRYPREFTIEMVYYDLKEGFINMGSKEKDFLKIEELLNKTE